MVKKCKRCKLPKDTDKDEFRKRTLPNGTLWTNTICRECERTSNRQYHKDNLADIRERKRPVTRAWRDANKDTLAEKAHDYYLSRKEDDPDFARRANLKSTLRKYGLSMADYDAMLEAQQGGCAICGVVPGTTNGVDRNRLVIDHDHSTGRVRALLCDFCNRGLGMFYDNPDLLAAAAGYLLQHEEVVADGVAQK